MKRFALWFVLGLLGIIWLHDARHTRSHRPVFQGVPPGVVFSSFGPDEPFHVSRSGHDIVIHGNGHSVVLINDHDEAADPRVEAVQRKTAAVEARLREVQRLTRNPADPALVRLEKQLNALKEEQQRIAQQGRPAGVEESVARETAEGLPVPVVPGTRTTEARIEPPAPPVPPRPPRALRPPLPRRRPAPPAPPVAPRVEPTLVTGRLSATPQRAIDDARLQFVQKLKELLRTELPADWTIPKPLIDRMIVGAPKVETKARDYGTLYEATLKVDLSPNRQRQIVAAYHREQVVGRMLIVGAVLAVILIGLAALSAYIRADEATKGYYTTRLRVVTTAAAVAGAVAVYRVWLS